MRLIASDLHAIEGELCSRSLAEYCKRAWPVLEPATPLKWGWALDAMCEHLEAVTNGDILRLVMNVPPGTMKSLLLGVFWPSWEWGPKGKPFMRYLGTAHEEKLALRDSRKFRSMIKSDWFQSHWGINILRDLDGVKGIGNDQSGVREARPFTSMTGNRADRVLIDDPIAAFAANSPQKLHAARIAFLETLPTRVNNDQSATVIAMQRLSEGDTTGVILEKGLDYTHLVIPMRFEPDRRCTTSIGWSDPRTVSGELMFPERFSESYVAELEKTLGPYSVAGQLQQRPTPRGGGLFKDEWWDYYTVAPKISHRSIYADTAMKAKEQNDYSVFQCWGRTVDGRAILLDQLRGKWEAPDLQINARAFWIKHVAVTGQGVLRAFKVEDKASGTGLIQGLKREGLPMVPIQRATDKVTRAMDAAPFISAGLVLLPKEAPWLSDYISEFSAFPNGAHDDQVDPTMDAVTDMLQATAEPKIRAL